MNALTPIPRWNEDAIGIDADGKWFISAGQTEAGGTPVVLRKGLRGSGNFGTSILARGRDQIAQLQLLDREDAKKQLQAAIQAMKPVEMTNERLLNGTQRLTYFNTLGHQVDRSTPEELVSILRTLGGFVLKQKETGNRGISNEVIDVYTRVAYTLSYWIELLHGVDAKVNFARFESFRLNDFKKLDLAFKNEKKPVAEVAADTPPAIEDMGFSAKDIGTLTQVKDANPALELYCAWLLKPVLERPSHSRIADMMDIDTDQVRTNFKTAEKLLKNLAQVKQELEADIPQDTKPDPDVEDFGYFKLQRDDSLGHTRYRVVGARIIVPENSYFWLLYVRDHPLGSFADAAREMGVVASRADVELRDVDSLLKNIFTTLKIEDPIPLIRHRGNYRYYRQGDPRVNVPGDSPADRLEKKLEEGLEIITAERKLLAKSKDVRDIFEVAVKHLTPKSVKFISMIYMREQRMTTRAAAAEMDITLHSAQTKLVRQRQQLLPHLNPKLRDVVKAWRAKKHP